MSPPVGPTGLPQSCDGESARKWRVGAGFAAFDTAIDFADAGRSSFQQTGAAASLDYRVSDRFTLQAAAGSAIGGHIVFHGVERRIKPGPLASLAVSMRILDDSPRSPFLVSTLSLAQSFVSADGSALRATDARLGVVLGKTIGPFAPFVTGRVFGGPVMFKNDVGGDRYHYQVGAGALFFVKGFDAAVEVAFLGERRATVSVGVSF